MNPNDLPRDDASPFHAALEQSFAHWNLVPEKTSLIRDGVNHVFATESASGEPVIIRISDGAVRCRDEVLGELIWLSYLNQHGCTVTTPIPAQSGALLETITASETLLHVSCFERFGGRELNPNTDTEWNEDLLVKLGREIGRVHRVSDELKLPAEHDRLHWHQINLGQFPEPLPDIFHPEVVEAMRVFTDDWISRPTTSPAYGLVHRDLHAGNFLVEDGRVELIDFDLGCYGWRMMDLAVLLFVHYFYPSLKVPGAGPDLVSQVLAQLVRGYREEYTLAREQLETMGDMIMLNTMNNYFLMKPQQEHWQTAMGNPQPPISESLDWIERLWLSGETLRVDLSKIPAC